MAKPRTLSFANFVVLIENTPGSGVFTSPCAFTSKAYTQTKDMVDIEIPDCDDPDAPTWIERNAKTLSAQIQGEGRLAMADLANWRAFFRNKDGLNCRIQCNESGANGGGYDSATFHLTSFEVGAEKNDRVTISVTMSSDGDVTWTAAA